VINDKVNQRVERANKKLNRVDWAQIQDQINASTDAIVNSKWDNLKRKDDKWGIDMDFLGDQVDLIIDQANETLDVIGQNIDKANEEEVAAVEVVEPEVVFEYEIVFFEPIAEPVVETVAEPVAEPTVDVVEVPAVNLQN